MGTSSFVLRSTKHLYTLALIVGRVTPIVLGYMMLMPWLKMLCWNRSLINNSSSESQRGHEAQLALLHLRLCTEQEKISFFFLVSNWRSVGLHRYFIINQFWSLAAVNLCIKGFVLFHQASRGGCVVFWWIVATADLKPFLQLLDVFHDATQVLGQYLNIGSCRDEAIGVDIALELVVTTVVSVSRVWL